jgi:hypothetical protein
MIDTLIRLAATAIVSVAVAAFQAWCFLSTGAN